MLPLRYTPCSSNGKGETDELPNNQSSPGFPSSHAKPDVNCRRPRHVGDIGFNVGNVIVEQWYGIASRFSGGNSAASLSKLRASTIKALDPFPSTWLHVSAPRMKTSAHSPCRRCPPGPASAFVLKKPRRISRLPPRCLKPRPCQRGVRGIPLNANQLAAQRNRPAQAMAALWVVAGMASRPS